ncbi:MAG: macrolide ABC transporter permease [Marivirga sp.]|nr:macrolide ABC transporter permease [Marivirga sp.]
MKSALNPDLGDFGGGIVLALWLQNSDPMFKNYLKIAFRTLMRTKVYSFINIFGLSLGVACCLLLSLYIHDEFNYDRHHQRLNDLYRIDTQFDGDVVGFDKLGYVSPPIAMTLKDELPEIEVAARVVGSFSAENLIQYEDKKFYESNAFIADSTLFDVLTYEFKEGHPKKALTDANTVVLSEPLASKLFGNESALNKSILISQGGSPVNYKVTGVYKNNNSFLMPSFISSMMSEGLGEYIRTNPQASTEWAGQNFVQAYIRLVPGHSQASVEKKINEVLIKYGSEDMKALGFSKTLFLEPVQDIYLKSSLDKNRRITYIYIIASIALFILLLACINFMNLSTAKAAKRASEIGIRKAMGAFRGSLIRQILGEALVIVLIAILISTILVQVALPGFNELSGKNITLNQDNILYFGVALMILTFVTGLIAGSYPAFYMSSFKPAEVLKGKFALGNASGQLRQGLVIFQFVIAIALVCGMFVISKQLSFMKEKDLGFDPEAKVIIPLRTDEARQKYASLKSEVEQMSSINGVSAVNFPPGSQIFNDMAFYVEGGSMDNAILNRRNSIDAGYMELLGIKLIAGRAFTDNRQAESQGQLIINRTSANKFKIDPENIVGRKLYFDWQGENYKFEVIGVMEDYNQTSLKDPIIPIVFEMADSTNQYNFMVTSVNPSGFSETIAGIEDIWEKQVSDAPFEYSFLDDNIQKQYNEDRRISKIISYFSVIAMIICSLGLYGLSSFMAEQRLKEIGVRKVMGASVTQIVGMMSKEFVRLVLLAFGIAIPLSWYAMQKWLEGFEYKTTMTVAPFVYAGLSALVIALLTISYESLRAANANPAKILRSE